MHTIKFEPTFYSLIKKKKKKRKELTFFYYYLLIRKICINKASLCKGAQRSHKNILELLCGFRLV